MIVKATVPVGAAPFTMAVKVMFTPALDGFAELARLVVLALMLLTTCDSVELVEPLFAASPL